MTILPIEDTSTPATAPALLGGGGWQQVLPLLGAAMIEYGNARQRRPLGQGFQAMLAMDKMAKQEAAGQAVKKALLGEPTQPGPDGKPVQSPGGLLGGLDQPTRALLGTMAESDPEKAVALLGTFTKAAQDAEQRRRVNSMISTLPPDQQVLAQLDPGAFASARAKSLFDLPSGMRMGPSGPEWVPGYIEGQANIRAAGKPSVNVQVSGEKKGSERMYTDAAEAFGTVQAADRMADRNAMLYGQMEQALEGFKPGATAELRLKAGKILQDFGVNSVEGVDQGELAKAIGRKLELVAAGQMKGQGQITENERAILRESLPTLTTTLEGNRQVIGMLRRLDSHDKQVAQVYRENARRNGGIVDPVSVAEEVAKIGPALSASDVVWLKGGGGQKAAPAGLPPVDQRRVGDVYPTPRGPAKWLGNGWELQGK